jgi:hypothetical protein
MLVDIRTYSQILIVSGNQAIQKFLCDPQPVKRGIAALELRTAIYLKWDGFSVMPSSVQK